MGACALLVLLEAAGPAAAAPDRYEALVAEGVSQARLGHPETAERAFDQAMALDPRRPEALVERGGLWFLQKDYARAAADFRRALARHDDRYARDMLATSLHLAGRPEAALREWNRLGQPALGRVEVAELPEDRRARVRRELAFSEGSRLTAGQVERSRLRLEETGLYARVRVQPVPRGGGVADVQVAVAERRGFFDLGPMEAAVTTVADAVRKQVRLQYRDVLGSGAGLGLEWRWERTQPRLAFTGRWARPLGLPANLHGRVLWERPRYDVGSELTLRAHGFDLGARRVVGPRTVAEVSFETRQRSFSEPRPDAPPGRVTGLELGLDHVLARGEAQTITASLRFFQAASWLGSALVYPRGLARLRYARVLAGRPEDRPLPRTEIAAQVQWGGGSRLPLDAMFMPGAAAEMELPLRGHLRKDHGILGSAPISRSLALANLEWRQRVCNTPWIRAGIVVFYDGGRAGRIAPTGRDQALHDIGVGMRFSVRSASTVRIDYGHSLTGDGKSALTAGIGQAF